MRKPGPRGRRRRYAAIAAAFLLFLGPLAARPVLERAVRAHIESEATRRGVEARIGLVHVGVWPPLRLDDVVVELTRGSRLRADRVEAWWPGRTQLVVEDAVLEGPAEITVASRSTTWDIDRRRGDELHFTLVQPQSGLAVSRTIAPHGTNWVVEAKDLPVGGLLDVRRQGRMLLDGGTMQGAVTLEKSAEALRFEFDVLTRDARLPSLAGRSPDGASLGEPTDLAVRGTGSWSNAAGSLQIPQWSAAVAGAEISGSLTLADLERDPSLDLMLDVEHLHFARLLRAAGVALPETLGAAPGDGDVPAADADLGSVRLVAHAQGRTSDPASFTVTQQLEFTPPRRIPPAIERLRGEFTHVIDEGGHRIDVSPASPDFIALGDVPPLFVRALLLAEDAGFYGHRGIDLRELPSALLTDLARGGAARGASTITQQLAKNLFLSREKRLGRKLQELAVTFLLESALGKNRILEIYLNVIEWGPDLHGLRPAARTYFGREPRDLTPAQMAFLITLIPAPVKYQVSFAHGTPGPGLRGLMNDLLAKLRSVDAISEEEYQRAIGEEIVVLGRE